MLIHVMSREIGRTHAHTPSNANRHTNTNTYTNNDIAKDEKGCRRPPRFTDSSAHNAHMAKRARAHACHMHSHAQPHMPTHMRLSRTGARPPHVRHADVGAHPEVGVCAAAAAAAGPVGPYSGEPAEHTDGAVPDAAGDDARRRVSDISWPAALCVWHMGACACWMCVLVCLSLTRKGNGGERGDRAASVAQVCDHGGMYILVSFGGGAAAVPLV